MTRIVELRTRRQGLAERAAALRAKTDRSTEETEQYDQTINQLVETDHEIEREENYLDSERRDAEYTRSHGGSTSTMTATREEERTAAAAAAATHGERRAGDHALIDFRSFASQPSPIDGRRPIIDLQAYVDANYRSWMRGQGDSRDSEYTLRAFQVDSETEGGYLVRPEQFVARLIQAVDNQVFVRQLATVFQVADATALGAPSLDTDVADADWTIELGTGSEETSLRLGKRSLTPHPLAKRIKLSKTLLRLAALDPEGLVISRLAYKIGITQEKGFLTGTGVQQPLGAFTASADGISTGRDVSTGNTTTSMTFDGLQEAKFSIKQNYWSRLQWMFHRDGVKQLAKLKDGDGQYIWQPSVVGGQPDRILTFPIMMSEYAPNTFTTGLYVGLLGDWSNYWIADALGMTMQRLVELYAETNQVGYIARLETDGMPVLEEAFARVKLA